MIAAHYHCRLDHHPRQLRYFSICFARVANVLKRWFRRNNVEAPSDRRNIDVGWLLDKQDATVIWDDPRPVAPDLPKPVSSKSASLCPAVLEFDRRHFVIPAPIDLHFRLAQKVNGELQLINVAGEYGPVRPAGLNTMFVVMPQHEWRHPARPVLQIATPYIFVSDDPVYINQFPPFLHHQRSPMPGLQLCGRFPIDVWPRQLMWAFEWHDIAADLILKRGDPWFYVRFEGTDPSARVRLFEAERTAELDDYLRQITDVSNYVNQTFSLFKTARKRRPRTLLVRKRKGD